MTPCSRAAASRREVGLGVGCWRAPRWGQEEGRGVPAAEQVDAEVALARVDEHAGEHLPAGEGVAVGAGRRLASRGARHVGEGALRHHAAGRRPRGRCRRWAPWGCGRSSPPGRSRPGLPSHSGMRSVYRMPAAVGVARGCRCSRWPVSGATARSTLGWRHDQVLAGPPGACSPSSSTCRCTAGTSSRTSSATCGSSSGSRGARRSTRRSSGRAPPRWSASRSRSSPGRPSSSVSGGRRCFGALARDRGVRRRRPPAVTGLLAVAPARVTRPAPVGPAPARGARRGGVLLVGAVASIGRARRSSTPSASSPRLSSVCSRWSCSTGSAAPAGWRRCAPRPRAARSGVGREHAPPRDRGTAGSLLSTGWRWVSGGRGPRGRGGRAP